MSAMAATPHASVVHARRAVPPGPTGRLNLFVHCDQEPVADAGIHVWSAGNEGVDATTDTEGRASIDVPAGEWWIRLRAENHQQGLARPTIHVVAGPDPLEIEIPVERVVWIEGVVVDQDDVPVADASVNYRAGTDSQGRFRVAITASMPLVGATFPGSIPARHFFRDFEDAGFLRLVLQREGQLSPGRVKGLVLSGRDDPVGNALVFCTAKTVAGRIRRDTYSNDAGRFELDCGGSPAQLMVVSAEGLLNNIDVKDGDDLTLRMPGRRSVKGRAIDATGAPVTTLRVARGKYSSEDVVSADGSFALRGFAPEKYTLTFSAPRFAAKIVRTVDLTSAETDVDLGDVIFPGSTRLTGVVVDQATGLPIVGAHITGNGLDVQTNTRGAFEIQIDSGLRLELDVSRPGFVARYVTVDPQQRDVRIALSRSADAGIEREFGGIGTTTSPLRDGGVGVEITAIGEGGPASQAGILVGDEVLAIDGEPAVGPLEELLTRIRGPVDTVVRLTLRREGRIFEVRVTRKLIRY